MSEFKLTQHEFGKLKEYGVIKGLNDKGYDATLDLFRYLPNPDESRECLGFAAYTYLVRRLGPPISGSEPTKIGRYVLSTPNPKIVVRIDIDTDVHIEILAEKTLGKEYLNWYFAPVIAWWNDCFHWAIETHNKAIYDSSISIMSGEKKEFIAPYFNQDIELWKGTLDEKTLAEIEKRKGLGKNPFDKAMGESFFEWKSKECDILREEYKETNSFPIPSGSFSDVYNWHKEKHSEGVGKVFFDAVNGLIEELLKPVPLGNTAFNILGFHSTETEKADVWQFAGNGFIEYNLTDYKLWVDTCMLATEMGNGDMQRGFNKAFAPHKNAAHLKKSK